MNLKKMRDYSHEDFVSLIKKLNEYELLELSAKGGGYPVLYRMSLDPELCHIPFIQPGSCVIIRNPNGEVLLQRRTDRDMWCIPGGCQELGENLKDTAVREAYEETGIKLEKDKLILIDIVSGKSRRSVYPNGDIVYCNSTLYLEDVGIDKTDGLKGDSETRELKFFKIDHFPPNFMDQDLIDVYKEYINKGK